LVVRVDEERVEIRSSKANIGPAGNVGVHPEECEAIPRIVLGRLRHRKNSHWTIGDNARIVPDREPWRRKSLCPHNKGKTN